MKRRIWSSPRRFGPLRPALSVGVAALVLLCCSEGASPDRRPDLLWVVWDTVRADRMSLYGHSRLTTPHLQAWAREARVFDDCLSTAPNTVPSHASMFTGLLPSEHGASNRRLFLDDRHATLAELLREAGYQTYLWSANPHVSREENFHQGFDVEEHPWDPRYRDEALRIVQGKLEADDRSSELRETLEESEFPPWGIKAAGELARRALEAWLDARDPDRPFFAFLNYMEAHRPLVPPRRYRSRVMTPDQISRSYQVDRSWTTQWSYTFGRHEYDDGELELMAATYDAALLELDSLFHDLIEGLRTRIDLDRTVVVLSADHGEHLGEHHLLDHQFSLYDPVLRVPLVVRYPERFAPGRDPRPVMTFDLFPTLLELAGVAPPPGLRIQARHLDRVAPDRARLAEDAAPFTPAFAVVRRAHPGFDPAPWIRVLRALQAGGYKYIWASDGRHELYRYPEDRAERHDLVSGRQDLGVEMQERLAAFVSRLAPAGASAGPVAELPEEARRRLEALGYFDEGGEGDASTGPEAPALPGPAAARP